MADLSHTTRRSLLKAFPMFAAAVALPVSVATAAEMLPPSEGLDAAALAAVHAWQEAQREVDRLLDAGEVEPKLKRRFDIMGQWEVAYEKATDRQNDMIRALWPTVAQRNIL